MLDSGTDHPPSVSLDDIPAPARAILTYRKSVHKFFAECVYTQDETDKVNPVKPYPLAEKPHLSQLISDIQDEHLLAVVKHRRLMATWTGCGICLYEGMFFEGRFVAIVSKKEEDSDYLLRRCKFIYDNIPKDKLPIKPTANYKYCSLTFPDIGSEIHAFAQGADQLRQYTCSRIFGDEVAFWPNALQAFVSMKPTISGGGRVYLVTTRFPGFFKQLIEDTLDE